MTDSSWYKFKKELLKMSKNEIIEFFRDENGKYKCELTKVKRHNINKELQTRHFRIRLRKIRNSIDYLLEHPWSDDTSTQTKRHPRDNTSRLSQIKNTSQ